MVYDIDFQENGGKTALRYISKVKYRVNYLLYKNVIYNINIIKKNGYLY